MANQLQTPGVYVTEVDAFAQSMIEVPTSIPVFIGYTQTALNRETDVTGIPVRISSMTEYSRIFGGAPDTKLRITDGRVEFAANHKFRLFQSMRLYFANGGGPCWVVSVGDYASDPTAAQLAAPCALGAGILEETPEPSIICIPEAAGLEATGWKTVMETAINHCAETQSRVTLVDVVNGNMPRDHSENDVISGTGGLRSLTADRLDFAVAYYPWLHTTLVNLHEVTREQFLESSSGFRQALEQDIEIANSAGDRGAAEGLRDISVTLCGPADDGGSAKDTVRQAEQDTAHKAAMAFSPSYAALFAAAQRLLNEMPATPAIAGVYASVDTARGVFKAPANVALSSVVAPTVDISATDQEDLNNPPNGKAVNAIRTFAGEGVLVWGARTMDGNSEDWRYVNVRRTMIMLEQSIRLGLAAYVFEPNTSGTWAAIKSMISNFLLGQWQQGAMAGGTPDDAFSVEVGLGVSMTPVDVLNGDLRVVVKVALQRPAEFMVLEFQQKMQTS